MYKLTAIINEKYDKKVRSSLINWIKKEENKKNCLFAVLG